MIYIRIEKWLFGNKDHSKLLGEGYIYNDGTGTPELGNYKVHFNIEGSTFTGAVKDFPRLDSALLELIQHALESLNGTSSQSTQDS